MFSIKIFEYTFIIHKHNTLHNKCNVQITFHEDLFSFDDYNNCVAGK